MRNNQQGFGVIGILLATLVVVVLCFTAWSVVQVRSHNKAESAKEASKQAKNSGTKANVAEINQLLERVGIRKLHDLVAYPNCGNNGYTLRENDIEVSSDTAVKLKSVATELGLDIDTGSDGYVIGKDAWSIIVPTDQGNDMSYLDVNINSDEKPVGFPAGYQNCNLI